MSLVAQVSTLAHSLPSAASSQAIADPGKRLARPLDSYPKPQL
jgi:hypothetical protein